MAPINLVRAALLALAVAASHGAHAQEAQGKAIEHESRWVLIETHISTESNGGAIGSSFQEFSTKGRCEDAIKMLMDLSERHRGSMGGRYRKPIAQCTPK